MSKGPRDPGDGGSFSLDDFVTDESTGIEKFTFADKVKDRLREIGVGDHAARPRLEKDHAGIFPDLRPGDYFNGQLPVVIRKLTLDQLSALYSLFSRWFGYLVFQTNLIAAERSEAIRQKEFLWSHVRKQYKTDPSSGKKNSDQIMSDLARGDFRYVDASARYEELNALYTCMNATLEVVEQDMKVISREVTINQTKLEKELMGQNFNKRTSRPWKSREADDGEPEDTSPPPKRRVRIAGKG